MAILVPIPIKCFDCQTHGWITKNYNYKKYVVSVRCDEEIDYETLKTSDCICPELQPSIGTCACATSPVYGLGRVDIVCTGSTITDDKMGAIIANLPATTPIGTLDLSRTGISQVPPGLTSLKTMSELNLASNQISLVNNGALAVNSSTLMKLDLSGNANLTTIANSSLPSKLTNERKYVYYTFCSILSSVMCKNGPHAHP